MKKILMALAITGFTYFSAEAQATDSKKSCGVTQDEVCRKGQGCYKTKYAENFKVCKSNKGYFICCETTNYNNSTQSGAQDAAYQGANNEQNDYAAQNENMNVVAGNAPQSQSYASYDVIKPHTYGGYYFQKGKIKACYIGNNVAEENRAPYEGCPSPQYDGPEKNRERNVNVVNLPEGQ